jgi:hypothetical protein
MTESVALFGFFSDSFGRIVDTFGNVNVDAISFILILKIVRKYFFQ